MRINNLTFGQLLKLKHPTTLMRVTRARDAALRTCWGGAVPGFFVSLAERAFPAVAARYNKVIAFLTGHELRAALRKAADEAQVPYIPGARRVLVSIRLGVLPQAKWEAMTRATTIQAMCWAAGVPSFFTIEPYRWGPELVVYAETNELGEMLLLNRHGLPWGMLCALCENMDVSAARVFDWVPQDYRDRNALVNPIVFPVNTPDSAEIAESLLSP
jgi:hypothetical protein